MLCPSWLPLTRCLLDAVLLMCCVHSAYPIQSSPAEAAATTAASRCLRSFRAPAFHQRTDTRWAPLLCCDLFVLWQWDICIGCASDAIVLAKGKQEEAARAVASDFDSGSTSRAQSSSAAPEMDAAVAPSTAAASPSLDSDGVGMAGAALVEGNRTSWASELALMGFGAVRSSRAAAAASTPSAAISALLNDVDSDRPDLHSQRGAGASGLRIAWQLVGVAYWPPSLKMAEGMDKIRCFMHSYTERSSDLESGSGTGIGSELDLINTQSHLAESGGNGDAHSAAASRKERRGKADQRAADAAGRSVREASASGLLRVPHYQFDYAVDHDAAAHRHEFGQWRASFYARVVYHAELLQLYWSAQRTQEALTILYARRCLLSLLHLLKDQLRAENGASAGGFSTAASPQTSRHASPHPSPRASPHHRATSSQASPAPSIRSLRPSSPGTAIRALSSGPSPVLRPTSSALTAPPSPVPMAGGRRVPSSGHSLSSFGPAGFLARFVALLCSAPHQLTIPHAASQLDVLSGGGGRAGLANLGNIVHTILLAERARLAQESGRASFVSQRDFAVWCPIARHLLQDAVLLMMRLCRKDAAVERHSLLNTVIYIMEAFFALEDARLHSHHRRLMSIYGGDAAQQQQDALAGGASSGSRANLMLLLLFSRCCSSTRNHRRGRWVKLPCSRSGEALALTARSAVYSAAVGALWLPMTVTPAAAGKQPKS